MYYEPDIKYPVVYNAQTTYGNDYRKYENLERQRILTTRKRSEAPEKPPAPHKPLDNETLSLYRENVKVPFDLLWEKKPITQTNPFECFAIPEKEIDEKKEDVMKTRPRLYKAPAVSLDDVADPEMRRLLLEHLYTTDWRKSEREAAGPITKRTIPNTTVELFNRPVSIKGEVFPPVPFECKQKAIEWDRPQTRAFVDPTRSFWLNKEPRVKCGACENPYKGLVDPKVKEEIGELVRTEKLRMPHDRHSPSYTGYKPELATGVTLRKKDLPVTHPLVSVAQALDIRQRGGQ